MLSQHSYHNQLKNDSHIVYCIVLTAALAALTAPKKKQTVIRRGEMATNDFMSCLSPENMLMFSYMEIKVLIIIVF